jgi:hypothetical protein
MTPATLRVLMTDLIDYAGLFPPAGLAMDQAVEGYNRALMGPQEWMLGRFVCPVSRLGEFERAAGVLMPGTLGTSGYREAAGGDPWRLSVLMDGAIETDLDAIEAFNQRHAGLEQGRAVIDAVEVKVARVEEIDPVLDALPEDLYPFFEFPVGQDCRGFVAALAGEPAAAKIRTGGVQPAAFPTPAEVAAFLVACASVDVPFKATAGLHHPVRGAYPLTYEAGSASCTMFGFVNIFVGAALARLKGATPARIEAVLAEDDITAFRFSETLVTWGSVGVEVAQLAKVREAFALSFGSCSFDEPVQDLRRAGLLE